MDTVLGCLTTDSVGPGEYTEKFLKNAKETFGYESAIALRSPYIALSTALGKLGLNRGSKIALNPLAGIYQRMVVEELGYGAEYYDIDPQTCLPKLEEIQSKGCSAIIVHDTFGMLPRKSEVESLGLPVIEDMTQALGASRAETTAGSLGNLSIYGLEQGSAVTAGGGALLFTTSRRDAPIVRNLAEFLPQEILLTDFNSALGLAQLKDLSVSTEKRKSLEEVFQRELARTRHSTFRQADEGEGGRYAFPIMLETGMKDVIVHAKRNGIEAAPAFERSIISEESFPETLCPGARMLSLRCVLFPLHDKLSAKDASVIGKVIATLP